MRESFTKSPNTSISPFQNKRTTKLPNANNLEYSVDLENESAPEINTWNNDDLVEEDQFRPEIHRIINPEPEKIP